MFAHAIILKKDWILFFFLMAAAGMLALCLAIFGKDGDRVTIYVDGREVESCSLQEERRIRIQGVGGGENLVILEGGMVWMEEADCPDRLCVRQGGISRSGESIVCLPHRVVVAVERAVKEEDTDAIVH